MQKRLRYTKSEHKFIRSKNFVKKVSKKHARKIATKALARAWEKYSNLSDSIALVHPTQHQKIHGGNFPKEAIVIFKTQMRFLSDNFVAYLPKSKRAKARKLLFSLKPRMLTIPAVLKEKDLHDVEKMYAAAIELYAYLKNQGEIYPALLQESTGKFYLAKGWADDPETVTAPIHESIHRLALAEFIAIDVPFAYTAERLYGFEKGINKMDKKMRMPPKKELDIEPTLVRSKNGKYQFSEPYSSLHSGYRLAQYIYAKIRPKKRW